MPCETYHFVLDDHLRLRLPPGAIEEPILKAVLLLALLPHIVDGEQVTIRTRKQVLDDRDEGGLESFVIHVYLYPCRLAAIEYAVAEFGLERLVELEGGRIWVAHATGARNTGGARRYETKRDETR